MYHNNNDPMGGKSISLHRKECGLGCAEDVCIHERCSRCTTTGCSLCSTKLIIRSGSTLVVNGTMIISGQLDGGGAAQDYTGATTGYYAELKLESGAKIEVNGTLHVPGFITESNNGESIVKINTDGTIYQPFVVRDFKGGTVTGAIYNSIKNLGIPYSPFNEFCTMNVYAPMHIYGSVISYANIYADDKQNATVAPLVGLTSSSFIQLSDDAYIVADYDLETEILKMDFYGGATTNSFSVSVNAPMIGLMTMTSQQFIFPISWMYDITLHDGSYNMTNGNRFKLLPGSKFTVESDASLEISYLQVYESFVQEAQVKSYRARYQKTPAIFTVNGTVNVEELGGKVYTTTDSASLTITKSVSLSSVEPLTYPDKEAVVAGAAAGLAGDLAGGLLGDTGCVSTNMTIDSSTTLYYQYYDGTTLKNNQFSGTIKINCEYLSNSDTKQWEQQGDGEEGGSGGTTEGGNENPCVTPDTLITLADGTQKEIQYVTDEDIFIVWDFFKGEFAYVPGAVLINHGEGIYTIITLTFDDGTVLKVVGMHGLYSKDLNDWVYIDKDNVESFVGTTFINTDGESLHEIKLIDYTITEEYTTAYSMFTALHYNCFFENILTLTPSMFDGENYYIPFEIGEGMKYDEEKMKEDIETYGLYTYEDFAEHVTYEQFVGFNAAYFKVSVGKGLVTYEQLIESIYSYVNPDS